MSTEKAIIFAGKALDIRNETGLSEKGTALIEITVKPADRLTPEEIDFIQGYGLRLECKDRPNSTTITFYNA